ncbi:MAG: DGQHR domain-containing protein [Nitrospirae bacterium]|nr:DGQHR domain-containing protein [Nitrospirota bacterium]
MAKISLSALALKYNQVEFYLTVMNAKRLFKIAKVSRAEEDPEMGFQRALGKQRAINIKKYIEDGNVIPGAIILSAQEKADFNFDHRNRTITFNEVSNSFLVIDGQHRLYGANMSEVEVILPLCIFNGLNTEQEVQYFLDVNGYQKGVPKTLRIELLKFIAEPTSKDAIRKALFDALDKDVESPLAGKMARTKSVPGKISHVPFKNAIDPLLDLAPMNNLSQDQRVKLLFNYLTAVENILIETFGNSDKLSNTAFFQAIMGAFIDACNLAMTRFNNYKVESFEKVFEPLKEIDFEYHKGTNQQAIKELSSVIRNVIAISQKVSEDIF